METLLIIAVISFTYAGFVLLSLGMEKHYRQLFKKKTSAQILRLLKAGGWVCLLLALLGSMRVWGIGIGTAAWCGIMMVLAGMQVLLLAYTKG